MASKEIRHASENSVATLELAGTPDDVLDRIESSDNGQCTVALSSGARDGLESDGGDRSAVGDGATRGDEAATGCTLPRSKAASPGRRAPGFPEIKKAEVRYSVRVGGARTAQHLDDLSGMYFSLPELRQDFARSLLNAGLLPADIATDDENFFIGFIRPGHGSKGQKVSVACDEDLTQMYEVCRSRRNDILLWYCLSREAASAYDTYDVYIPHTGKQRRHVSPPSSGGSEKRRRPPPKSSGGGSPGTGPFAGHPMPYPSHLVHATGSGLRPLTSPTAATGMVGGQTGTASRAAVALSLHGLTSAAPYEKEHVHTAGSPNLLSPHSRELPPRHIPFSMFSGAYALPVCSTSGDGTAESPSGTPDITPRSIHILKERVEVRRLLISQLKEWNDLHQADVIDGDIFHNHKTKILADLDRL